MGIHGEDRLAVEGGGGTGADPGDSQNLLSFVFTCDDAHQQVLLCLGLFGRLGKDELDLHLNGSGIVAGTTEQMHLFALFAFTQAALADAVILVNDLALIHCP